MEKADILIQNANELITLKGSNNPRKNKQMNELSIIEKGSVVISDGKIIDVGKNLRYNAVSFPEW